MSDAKTTPPLKESTFVNEMRLSAKQWLAVFAIVVPIILFVPPLWKKLERFEAGADYRIPYALSKDYWLYERRLEESSASNIVLFGDSVVWGEYVLPDGTLSHFLNQEIGATNRFINAGLNGLFPLAMEGLVRSYTPLRHRKVILHCNALWMTSPKADLSTEKEEQFNHTTLVPQFSPKIPCYRADTSARLNAIVERNVPFLQWVGHLQNAYFGQKSIPKWTLQEDDSNPPRYPNAYRNPFKQITFRVPSAPDNDPERGPASARHKPWFTNIVGTTRFEWVACGKSLQWQAFQRTVELLRSRGNDVLVVVGPFNENIMALENRPMYRQIHQEIVAWLAGHKIQYVVPELLPSALYADASHPLTEGYALLAKRILADIEARKWISK